MLSWDAPRDRLLPDIDVSTYSNMKQQILDILTAIRPEFEYDGVEDFFAEGMLDSFDLMVLVSTLDERFGIKIDGTDILPENFMNVEAIAALIERSAKR